MNEFAATTTASKYMTHSDSHRGKLRHDLVSHQIIGELQKDGLKILDVGGGDGVQAARLAELGHTVTIADSSVEMLRAARSRLATLPETVSERVTLVQADLFGLESVVADGPFDIVCCHGVLMYIEQPEVAIQALMNVVESGGLLSILAKNADALLMRPALVGDFRQAIALIGRDSSPGNLGISTRGDTVAGLTASLDRAGASVTSWYGVRVFGDNGALLTEAEYPTLLELNKKVSGVDPYRQVAPLIHLLARKTG